MLQPDYAHLDRLLRHITAALLSIGGVRGIALFGSLAENRADRWSDIDMIVGCEEVDTTKWSVAGAVRAAVPILYYQMFSVGDQPSGRYWLLGESPFHKLDVSFVSVAEYQRAMHEGTRLGHPIVLREVYAAEGAMRLTLTPPVAPSPLSFGEQEIRICRCHVPLMNSLHSRLRGRDIYPNSSTELEEKALRLRQCLDEVARDAVMAGGRIGVIAWQLLEMADYVQASSPGDRLRQEVWSLYASNTHHSRAGVNQPV